MRTTLTLDADVSALLKRVMRRRRSSLKQIVNEALKIGLQQQDGIRVAEPTVPYSTSPYDAGKLLLSEVSSIGDFLAREDELS